jgi:hypothetical protein
MLGCMGVNTIAHWRVPPRSLKIWKHSLKTDEPQIMVAEWKQTSLPSRRIAAAHQNQGWVHYPVPFFSPYLQKRFLQLVKTPVRS